MIPDIYPQFLSTVIVNTSLIYIDLWTIFHFIVGYLLYSKWKFSVVSMLLFLLAWEAFEMFVPLLGEYRLDTKWDIIIGILGYYAAKEKWI